MLKRHDVAVPLMVSPHLSVVIPIGDLMERYDTAVPLTDSPSLSVAIH